VKCLVYIEFRNVRGNLLYCTHVWENSFVSNTRSWL